MKNMFSASVWLALATPWTTMAQIPAAPGPEIDHLKQEIQALRADYERRMQALEARLLQMSSMAPIAAAVPTVASAAAPSAPAPQANTFNPALSLILSGGYTRTSRDPAGYSISGFGLPAGAEVGPGTRGFALGESELGFSASIDPWWRGVATVALHPDDAVSVEEAYVQTTALGQGWSLKAGRFLSGIGYLNSQHAHSWDFVDNPLAYQALLGNQVGDDGVQLKWLAPTEQFLEFGLELGRGKSYPGSDTSRNGAGMTALTMHTGADVGLSHSWRAGLSVLNAKSDAQRVSQYDAAGSLVENAFSGRTRIWVLDGVWKWAPQGNASHTSFKLQGEYLRSTRQGELSYDVAGVNTTDLSRSTQSGWYLQGVYQFRPNWRAGLRTERLNPGSADRGVNSAVLDTGSYRPSKNSLLLDYSPSEFSRVRLQLAHDQSREGMADKQLFLQYQMSLGAHGAHGY